MDKRERKHLSYKKLLSNVRSTFLKRSQALPERQHGQISTTDCMMSALAVFNYKWPSLLQYDHKRHQYAVSSNLERLYGVDQAPSDTYMRERLDPVDPRWLRRAFNAIFAQLQRANLLKEYKFMDDAYLLSLDGTGQYSSEKVSCKNCCQKKHRDGRITYYHQLLGAVLVHPEQRVVIPFAPEPIIKSDGHKKNDCERNASKRLLEHIRREHPHLKLIIVEDGLASNAPHIALLKKLNMHYILGAKPGDHAFLFEWVHTGKPIHHTITTADGVLHEFHFMNEVPLNDANFDVKVNFLEYWETHPNGKKQCFSWVTDMVINENNMFDIMRGGRSRWKIENETFNTLKNQGYHFEHNYGHGHDQLANVFSMVMMLAFLIDQAQMLGSPSFRAARAAAKSWQGLWEDMRAILKWFLLDSWEQLFEMIARQQHSPPRYARSL